MKKKFGISEIIIILIMIIVFFYFKQQYNKRQLEINKKTEEIIKTFSIRSSDYEKNIGTNESQSNDTVVEENKNEDITTQNENNTENTDIKNEENNKENSNNISEENNQNNLKKEESKKISKRFIHVATLKTEKQAQEELKRYSSGYKIKKVEENGKISFQIVSETVSDEKRFLELEKQAKKVSAKYLVRMVGK